MRSAPFKGNIIVWNLPEVFSEAQLAALFDDYGLVLGAKIDRFPYEPGRTARGLVDLAPAKAVDAAVEALDGFKVEAQRLKVRKVPESQKAAKPPKPAAPAQAVTVAPRPLSLSKTGPATPAGEPTVRAPVAPRKPVVEYRSLPSRRLAMTR